MQGLPSLLGMMEVAVNRYLRLDPDAFSAATEFAGHVVALDLRGIQESIFLHFTSDGVHLTLSSDRRPDARVKATPRSLLRVLRTREAGKLAFNSDVIVEGDTELIYRVKGVFDRVDVDWEEELSHFVGDIAAHQMGNMYRRAGKWGEKTWDTLQQDVVEYLVEEGRLTPHKEEISAFVEAIDTLRDDADRLEQRILRLLDGKSVRPS